MTPKTNKIAFQGEYGANSDMACRDMFPTMEPLTLSAECWLTEPKLGRAMISVFGVVSASSLVRAAIEVTAVPALRSSTVRRDRSTPPA